MAKGLFRDIDLSLASGVVTYSNLLKAERYGGLLSKTKPDVELYWKGVKILDELPEALDDARDSRMELLDNILILGAYNQLERVADRLKAGRIFEERGILNYRPLCDITQAYLEVKQGATPKGEKPFLEPRENSFLEPDNLIRSVMSDRSSFPSLISEGSNRYAMKRLTQAKDWGLKTEREMIDSYLENGLRMISGGDYDYVKDLGTSLNNMHEAGLISKTDELGYATHLVNGIEDIRKRKAANLDGQELSKLNSKIDNCLEELDLRFDLTGVIDNIV
jgi:hypothetical protein